MDKKKIEHGKEIRRLEICLSPVTVDVELGSEPFEESVRNALIAEINRKMPFFDYAELNLKSLTMESVFPGMLVESCKDSSQKGIITAVNSKTVNIALKGRRMIQGHPALFKATNASFEEVGSFYKKIDTGPMLAAPDYLEGHAGYLCASSERNPVVLGKQRGSVYKLFLINGNGRYFNLNLLQMRSFFKGE